MTAQQIANFAVQNLYPGYDFVTAEMGPYHSSIRFDVVGIRRSKRISRIIEIKMSRSDFLADKKWQKYLPYATHLYFLSPKGIIKPEELDPRVGLIEITPVGKDYFRYEFTRRCRRLQDLSVDCYIQLIEAIAWREWRGKTG